MRSDALQRRARILHTARELFAEHGANVAMELIAESSQVGIGTLYRNFSDRTQLVEEVTIDMLGEVKQAAQTALEGLEKQDPDAWQRFISHLLDLNLGALAEALGILLPASVSDKVMTPQREVAVLVQQCLEAAKAQKLVREDLTGNELITGIGIVTRPLPRVFSAAAPGLRERLTSIMLDGFAPRS